jgi:hypothetical protein
MRARQILDYPALFRHLLLLCVLHGGAYLVGA